MDFEAQGKFERGNIRLYQADCMEAMRQVPDKWYELAIVEKINKIVYTMSI